MAFEYPAESYRASAGFSGVRGKNNWSYHRWSGREYADLSFIDFTTTTVQDNKTGETKQVRSFANFWGDTLHCMVGDDYQIAGRNGAVRTWLAPHSGWIRVQGMVQMNNEGDSASIAKIVQNDHQLWPSRLEDHGIGSSHDLTVLVKQGDAIHFIVENRSEGTVEKVVWDPVITYEEE
jgi:hypothetical protein